MNEILIKKHMRQIMRYGVSKEMARDIVQTAYEVGKGNNIEKYINYALDLSYGYGFSQRAK